MAADVFLKLEKYVNINFTGFHKILKKHDRRLPNPCKAFYIARLHEQSWVRGDFSDVIVTMSRIYSTIRGDVSAAPNQDEKQVFAVRSQRPTLVSFFLSN
jgi:SPX domain protein involved in polyphosphate accumulation